MFVSFSVFLSAIYFSFSTLFTVHSSQSSVSPVDHFFLCVKCSLFYTVQATSLKVSTKTPIVLFWKYWGFTVEIWKCTRHCQNNLDFSCLCLRSISELFQNSDLSKNPTPRKGNVNSEKSTFLLEMRKYSAICTLWWVKLLLRAAPPFPQSLLNTNICGN